MRLVQRTILINFHFPHCQSTSPSQETSVGNWRWIYQKRGAECINTVFTDTNGPTLVLEDQLDGRSNVSPVFGYKNSKNDINFMKSLLLSLPVNERETETKLFMNANEFVACILGKVQSLEILNILGGTTGFDFFPKAHSTSKMKNVR